MNVREAKVLISAKCPWCTAGPHEVELITKVVRGTLLFGGPGKASASSIATAALTCPTTGQPFEVTFEVPVSEGERVDSVAVAVSKTAWPAPVASDDEVAPIPESVASHGPTPVASETPADWRAGELTEWLKNSANQGREEAAKLVVAGTAAVGAYFAILKVVAGEQIHTGDRALAIAPAIGYLVSTVLATLALLPALVRVFNLDDFERLREHRLKRLSLLISASVAVFVVSTVLAVIALGVLLP